MVELRGLDLAPGRGQGAALAAHRAAIHPRARTRRSKSLVELRGLEPLTSTLPVLRTSQLYYSPEHAYEDTTFPSARQGGFLLNPGKAARRGAKRAPRPFESPLAAAKREVPIRLCVPPQNCV